MEDIIQIYINKKNFQEYIIVSDTAKIKFGGLWLDAVVYKNNKEEIFVREKLEFHSKFMKQ